MCRSLLFYKHTAYMLSLKETLSIQMMSGGKNIRDFNPKHNQAHLQVAQANTQPKPV